MKSYTSIEQQICIVCCKKVDMGILLDRTLKDSLEWTTVTGFLKEPCEKCKKLMGDDRIALVGVDESKSKNAFLPNGNVDPEKVWRTGELTFILKSVWSEIFNVPIPSKMMFVDTEVIRKLNNVKN